MKRWVAIAGVGAGVALIAIPVAVWAANKRAAGDPETAAVVAMMVSENGIGAPDDAMGAVAEVFWRNAERADATPREVLAGKGGGKAPWPTATRYKALMATSRITLAADAGRARELGAIARAARTSERVPGATNWTHGGAPFEPWLAKGYTVVASFKVPSRTRPYLWVYRQP